MKVFIGITTFVKYRIVFTLRNYWSQDPSLGKSCSKYNVPKPCLVVKRKYLKKSAVLVLPINRIPFIIPFLVSGRNNNFRNYSPSVTKRVFNT